MLTKDLTRVPSIVDVERGRDATGDKSSPKLIVTVDTEEEGLWSDAFRAHGNTVRNIAGLERFQELCERFQIHPTYLVDTPVVEDEAAVMLLNRFRDRGVCEIGAHLHPWCAPPLPGTSGPRESFLCNLPADLQRAKLETLTLQIAEQFGRRPTSFRAGRYGLDAVGAVLLQELGYLVDSSVLPFTDFSAAGGPNFQSAPSTPYFVGPTDLLRPAPDGELLEVPISVGFNRSNFARAQRIREWAVAGVPRQLRLWGVLDRLNLLRRIKFTPEGTSARRLLQLVKTCMANSAPCMVFTLHSSSLVAGHSPYVRTEQDRDRLYRDMETVFDNCLNSHGFFPQTLTEFAASFAQRRETAK